MTGSLSRDQLLALAPLDLISRRPERYSGAGASAPLAEFSATDRAAIVELYTTLLSLFRELKASRTSPTFVDKVTAVVAATDWPSITQLARRIGFSARLESSRLVRVEHDIKGGALTPLLLKAEMLRGQALSDLEANSIYFLLRDHLKMMRNAVEDIDPGGRLADEQANLHHITLLTEKWSRAVHRAGSNRASINFQTEYDGNVAERCLEFSALDRVFYNVINNATRFAEDGRVDVRIFSIAGGASLRFVVYNRVSAEHVGLVREKLGHNASEVFRGGFTTGGSGFGLAICTEFVQNAYGLNSVDETIAGRYIGAAIVDDFWISWFHWPSAD